MEGSHFLATGELIELSESNLVDCSWKNAGCRGGNQDLAFEYAEKYPLQLESDYPYKTHLVNTCKYKKELGKVSVKTYSMVTPKKASQLKAALNNGPVSVSIDAESDVFNNYSKGVITSLRCGTELDHAVLAVGYGTQDLIEYILVKNSWGPDWGENGYVKIGVGIGAGICGVLTEPILPFTN